MKKSDESLLKDKKLKFEGELKHFKNVVKSLMNDASKVLADIELLSCGSEIVEKISLLNHYLDYTTRLCRNNNMNHTPVLERYKDERKSL